MVADAAGVAGDHVLDVRGRHAGPLHDRPQELLAQCLNAIEQRTGVNSTEIEDVIAGNASGIGDHGADIARLA
ncbi:MAG: hypothetical protein ACHQ02_10650, partial [Candidatus Limnocylindrales bacterium]